MSSCTWRWENGQWTLVSGPQGCPAPMPPRDPEGTEITIPCPPGLNIASDELETVGMEVSCCEEPELVKL